MLADTLLHVAPPLMQLSPQACVASGSDGSELHSQQRKPPLERLDLLEQLRRHGHIGSRLIARTAT